MLIITFIGYFVVFVLSKSNAQNCIYAPTCPSFVTWMPGYICDDGFFPMIKKKSVNGVIVKTICCSEISMCSSPQFWCQQQLDAGSSQSAAALAPSCSVGCVTQWKTYENDSTPMIDGLTAGFYTSGVESFIGRVRVLNGFMPGRIHINQPGMFYSYSGLERYANGSVEFLYSNPNYTYEWIASENGTNVPNAVTLNVPKSSAQYIGRISVNDGTFIGTVVRILGGMFYSDYSGVEQFTASYEVLVCNKPFTSSALASPPVCPIYWKSSVTQLNPITDSSTTLPMMINAQNGVLTGDLVHTYSWANLANLTANLITDVFPASLIMPGGLEYSVGRIFLDGTMIIGTVNLNSGIMQYSDAEGNINNVLCFEVLVCDSLPTSTTDSSGESGTSTINPSDSTTSNPSDGSDTTTINPADSTTSNPSDGSDTSTINPGDSTTSNPSDGSDTSTINPGDSTTSNPSDGSDTSTINPGDSTTSNPSDGSDTSTINPGDSTTTNPSDGSDTSTINPGDSTTSNPSDGSDTSTISPADSTTSNPSDGSDTSTINPADSTTSNPSDGSETSTINPADSTTSNPNDGSDTTTLNPTGSENTVPTGNTETTTDTIIIIITTPNQTEATTSTEATTISEEITVSDRSETTTQAISTDSTTDKASSHGSEVTTLPFTITPFETTITSETTTSIPSENLSTESTTIISTSSIPPSIITTVSTPIDSTTTETTTKVPPKTCIITWKDYTGIEDISTYGVNAGLADSNAGYVGQGNVYGNILPGRIQQTSSNSYCYYFGVENCLNNFQYLENLHDYTYSWVNSHNGEFVQDAVIVQSFFIGRIWSNSHLYLGTVVPGYGMVYFDNVASLWHYSNNSYQVLTCDPNPEVVLYDCNNKWAPYLNDMQPLIDGVYTDNENTTFVGRTTENKDYLVGRVRITPPSGLLHLTPTGSWSLDTVGTEYLLRNDTSSYQWIESSYGQPVEHAVTIRKSSSFWPMYIGRVQINSTYYFIGRVLPAQGIQFYDGNPAEAIITHYQVLTCTTTIPYDCGCNQPK